jgi:hypothetical protein
MADMNSWVSQWLQNGAQQGGQQQGFATPQATQQPASQPGAATMVNFNQPAADPMAGRKTVQGVPVFPQTRSELTANFTKQMDPWGVQQKTLGSFSPNALMRKIF